MTKHRPVIEDLSINNQFVSSHNLSALEEIDIDVTTEVHDGVALEVANLDEEEALLKTAEVSTGENLQGGKIKGNYSDYLSWMVDKHKIKKRSFKEGEKEIIIDSIDGAEHIKK